MKKDGGRYWVRTSDPYRVKGYENVEIKRIPDSQKSRCRIDATYNPWLERFFRSFLPTLVADGLVSSGTADAFWRDWLARAESPAAFLCVPPMFDVIGRKPTPEPEGPLRSLR